MVQVRKRLVKGAKGGFDKRGYCTVQYVGDMDVLFFFGGIYCTLTLLSSKSITDSIEKEIAQRREIVTEVKGQCLGSFCARFVIDVELMGNLLEFELYALL